MPTVADLQRLQALVDRLAPAAEVGRGELIRADDWNVVVGALIELARVVLAEGASDVVSPHEHPDQVAVGWLDPTLRTLVQAGPLRDPAAEARVTALERGVDRLTSRVADLESSLGQVRDGVTAVTSRDLVRQSQLTSVQQVLGGVSDGRDDVLALRGTLASIQANVAAAVDAGQRLTVGGQPVDMTAFDARVRSLETLQERLTTPDGQTLDAAGLENRLTELTNTLVSQDQLTTALEGQTATLSEDERTSLTDSIRASVLADTQTMVTTSVDGVRAEMTQRLADVNAIATDAVTAALPGQRDEILGTVRPEIAAAVDASATSVRADTAADLAAAETALRTSTDDSVNGVVAGIPATVGAQLDQELPGRLAPVTASLDQLTVRVGAAEGSIAQHETSIADLNVLVARESTDRASALQDLQLSLQQEMDARDAATNQTFDTRFTEFQTQTNDLVASSVSDARRDLLSQMDSVASHAAATEAATSANVLRGEMVGIAQDQVAGVRDELHATVSTQVQDATNQLPTIVSAEVRRQTATLPDLVRTEIATNPLILGRPAPP